MRFLYRISYTVEQFLKTVSAVRTVVFLFRIYSVVRIVPVTAVKVLNQKGDSFTVTLTESEFLFEYQKSQKEKNWFIQPNYTVLLNRI